MPFDLSQSPPDQEVPQLDKPKKAVKTPKKPPKTQAPKKIEKKKIEKPKAVKPKAEKKKVVKQELPPPPNPPDLTTLVIPIDTTANVEFPETKATMSGADFWDMVTSYVDVQNQKAAKKIKRDPDIDVGVLDEFFVTKVNGTTQRVVGPLTEEVRKYME